MNPDLDQGWPAIFAPRGNEAQHAAADRRVPPPATRARLPAATAHLPPAPAIRSATENCLPGNRQDPVPAIRLLNADGRDPDAARALRASRIRRSGHRSGCARRPALPARATCRGSGVVLPVPRSPCRCSTNGCPAGGRQFAMRPASCMVAASSARKMFQSPAEANFTATAPARRAIPAQLPVPARRECPGLRSDRRPAHAHTPRRQRTRMACRSAPGCRQSRR